MSMSNHDHQFKSSLSNSLLLLTQKLSNWLNKMFDQGHIFNNMLLSDLLISNFLLEKITKNNRYTEKAFEILKIILNHQNSDGSWNEKYPWLNIDVKSTLATAYVGYNLLSLLALFTLLF